MATIITRVFQDEASARKAARALTLQGVPPRDCRVIAAGSDTDSAAALKDALVHETALAAYSDAMAGGHAVLVVRATYKPLMAAQVVRDTLASVETVHVADVIAEHRVPDGAEPAAPSILQDHPLFLTSRRKKPGRHGLWSESMGFPLISQRKPRNSAISGGKHMSRAFWPMPLLSKKDRPLSVKMGGGFMSRKFWPMPLVSDTKRTPSVIKGGDLPFSRTLGLPTLIRR